MTTGTTGTTHADAVADAADQLLAAARTRTPCPPVRDRLPDTTVATGYQVQRLLTRARLDEGLTITGRKIGLTAPAVQTQLGVDQPDFGVLFDDMDCPQDRPIDIGRLLQPRIEAEIAFVLDADLDHDDITAAVARAAVAQVIPALEIVDSRVADWAITIVDTVADNASSGLYVLGDDHHELDGTDLSAVEMTLTDATGQVLSSGTGAACLGDPINALVWLARTAREFGAPLRAGEVILSGALGPMTPVAAGAGYTAALSGLGTVRAAFTPSTRGPA